MGVAYLCTKPPPGGGGGTRGDIETDRGTGGKQKGQLQSISQHAQPDTRSGYFGYLEICSRGLYFDPQDPAIPVLRFRYRDMKRTPHVEINPPGCYVNDLVATAERHEDVGNCIAFTVSQATVMKRHFRVAPYSTWTMPPQCFQYIALPFMKHAEQQVLPFVTQLCDICRQANAGHVFKEQELLDAVIKDRHQGEFDVNLLQKQGEIPLMSASSPWLVERIEPLVSSSGRLFVSSDAVYFQQVNINNVSLSGFNKTKNKALTDSSTLRWPLNMISQLFRRRRLLREVGLEINFSRTENADDSNDVDSDSSSDSSNDKEEGRKDETNDECQRQASSVQLADFSFSGLAHHAQGLGMQTAYGVARKRGHARRIRAGETHLSSVDVSSAVEDTNGVFLSFSSPYARDEAYALIREASMVWIRRQNILRHQTTNKSGRTESGRRNRSLPDFPTTANVRLPPSRGPGVFDEEVMDNVYKAQKAWTEGFLSNYDYLCILNYAADRTPLDITQYPVFPWVVADYSSDSLDLEDPTTFRDLTQPIGALNKSRLKKFQERMQEMPQEEGVDAPFLYGTHYSTPGYVLYYLIRGAPEHQLKLQAGRFDAPDRQFCSIADTWESVTGTGPDVKELTFEFFDTKFELLTSKSKLKKYGYAVHPSAWLDNPNEVPLGVKTDGTPVDQVALPPWSKDDPSEFVRLNRAALESEYVTHRLHHWINLIFGAYQRGEMARRYDNLFHPMTYEGTINLEEEASLERRLSLQAQIAEFGQTPRQIFTAPHPYYKGAIIPIHVPPKRPVKNQGGGETPTASGAQEETPQASSETSDHEQEEQSESVEPHVDRVLTAGAMHLKSFSRRWTPIELAECSQQGQSSETREECPSKNQSKHSEEEKQLPPLELRTPLQRTYLCWPTLHNGYVADTCRIVLFNIILFVYLFVSNRKIPCVTFLGKYDDIQTQVSNKSVLCSIGEDGVLALINVSSDQPSEKTSNSSRTEVPFSLPPKLENTDIADLIEESPPEGRKLAQGRLLHHEKLSDYPLSDCAIIPSSKIESSALLCPSGMSSQRQSLVQQHETVVVCDTNGSLYFFDAVARKVASRFDDAHKGSITCVDCCTVSLPLQRGYINIPLLCVSGGRDGSVHVWPITRINSSSGGLAIYEGEKSPKQRKPLISFCSSDFSITAVSMAPPGTCSPLATPVSAEKIPSLIFKDSARYLPPNAQPEAEVSAIGVYGTADGSIFWFDPLDSRKEVLAKNHTLVHASSSEYTIGQGNAGITSFKWVGRTSRLIASSAGGTIGVFSERGVCVGTIATGDIPKSLELPQPLQHKVGPTEITGTSDASSRSNSDSCLFEGPMQHSVICTVGSSSCIRFWDIRSLWPSTSGSQGSKARRASNVGGKLRNCCCSLDCELYSISIGTPLEVQHEKTETPETSDLVSLTDRAGDVTLLTQQCIDDWVCSVAIERRNKILAVGTEDGRICTWFKKFN